MKAALIIIGNEILSGRTQDKNLSYLANWLNEIGIQLSEVRVIRDEEEVIIETVNYLRKTYDYVFIAIYIKAIKYRFYKVIINTS